MGATIDAELSCLSYGAYPRLIRALAIVTPIQRREHISGEIRIEILRSLQVLRKDREVLLTFYDFSAEHWAHLRTTNPIESTFATIRLRQRRTKGCGAATGD